MILSDENNNIILKERVGVYKTPEEVIIQALPGAHFINPYTRDSIIDVGGHRLVLKYVRVELDQAQNELIYYLLTQ